MDTKEERKKKVLITKFFSATILIVIIGLLLAFGYQFESLIYNSLTLLVLSYLLTDLLVIDKYFIDSGLKSYENNKMFKLFCVKHPRISLYNKVLTMLFFITIFFSAILMLIGFFQSS